MRKWFLRHYQSDNDFRLTAVCMFIFVGCWVFGGIAWVVIEIARGFISQAVSIGIYLLFGLVLILLITAGVSASHAVIEDLQNKNKEE